MSRNEHFAGGAVGANGSSIPGQGPRKPTPEGWVKVRANTVYGTTTPLVAIPREHVLKDSHNGEDDHIVGYVTEHASGRGNQDRGFTLHTNHGPRVVSVKKRAWLYMHHGQARSQR